MHSWVSPSWPRHGHWLVQFRRCWGGPWQRGRQLWSLSGPSPCFLVRKILEDPGCWKAQLRVSSLEFISFMLLPRLPDWLRSVFERWQHYLLRPQLPCSFFLPQVLYRTFDTGVDICTWIRYTEFWESLESLPLSTSMWLLTTEIYNFWGKSNTRKGRTSIYQPLLSLKNSCLIFAITWQVYISRFYPLSPHPWLLI